MNTSRALLTVLFYLFAAKVGAAEAPLLGDTYVRASKPSISYGNNSNLWVHQPDQRQSLIQFDLSAASGTVESANLSLKLLALPTPGTIEIRTLAEPWTEGATTFNTAPSFNAPVSKSIELESSMVGSIVTIEITSVVQSWVDDPQTNFGLIVQPTGGTRARFSSGDGNSSPELNVTSGGGSTNPGGSSVSGLTTVALSGGDYASPEEALANVDSGDNWCGTPTPINRCLIKVFPGTYNLGNQTLQLRSFVDVTGSGNKNTTLTGAAAVLVGSAHNAKLTSIGIEGQTGSVVGIGSGIDGSGIPAAPVDLKDVYIHFPHRANGVEIDGSSERSFIDGLETNVATDGLSWGVKVTNSKLTARRLRIRVMTTSSTSHGIGVGAAATPPGIAELDLTDSRIELSGIGSATGISMGFGGDVIVAGTAIDIRSEGAKVHWGMRVGAGSDVKFESSSIDISVSPEATAMGILLQPSQINTAPIRTRVANSTVSVEGGSNTAALRMAQSTVGNPTLLEVNSSQISSNHIAVWAEAFSPAIEVNIGSSLLQGTIIPNEGVFRCFGLYNEFFQARSCP